MIDKIQERKDKIKPQKIFSILINIYDDGVLAGYGLEYRNMGRLKKVKMIVPDKDDFLTCVRSIIPSAIPVIEPVVEMLYSDIGVEDVEGAEKTAKINVDIYNDGYIDCDFSEIIKGNRGAPKAWRLSPYEFIKSIDVKVNNLGQSFKTLLNAGKITTKKENIEHD